jgi:hypothetical protein
VERPNLFKRPRPKQEGRSALWKVSLPKSALVSTSALCQLRADRSALVRGGRTAVGDEVEERCGDFLWAVFHGEVPRLRQHEEVGAWDEFVQTFGERGSEPRVLLSPDDADGYADGWE